MLTYVEVGVTDPAAAVWTPGKHRRETTIAVGKGEACWRDCHDSVLRWAVKTRSGFRVEGEAVTLRAGQSYELQFRVGPLSIREPVRVVTTVDDPDRCGFAYGTLSGHPVSGEEAFIVHRHVDGTVWLTVRSFTLPAPGWRRTAFPLFLLAQRVLRRRYLRALTDPDHDNRADGDR